jgi:hypothetical protein
METKDGIWLAWITSLEVAGFQKVKAVAFVQKQKSLATSCKASSRVANGVRTHDPWYHKPVL